MGQFKPMVKMMTTEPTVELKLKKGGSVKGYKCMKKGGKAEGHGHKPMGMMDGGISTALANARPIVRQPGPDMMPEKVKGPKKPPLINRMKTMAGRPVPAPLRAMKEGGESAKEHKAEMSKMKGLEQELKSHESKRASKAHAGLKTGGVVMGQGGYKTGGVVKGQGGYKTGGVVMGQGGYKDGGCATMKKGGSSKKFAEGGSVQDGGRPQKMAQGAKKPSSPVEISRLSGAFKKGGKVGSGNLQAVFKKENAPAMKAAKADSDLKYSKYQKVKKYGGGGDVSMTYDESFQSPEEQMKEMRLRKAMDAGYKGVRERETASNEALLDSLSSLPKAVKDMVRKAMRGSGAVTDTERTVSRTVVPAQRGVGTVSGKEVEMAKSAMPAKKRGGKV